MTTRRPVGDARPCREGRHPVGAGQQDRLAVLALLDQIGPPVDEGRARDVPGRVDGRTRCRPAASGGRGCGSPAGRGCSASHSVVARSSGRGQATHRSVSYGRGRPVHARPEKLAAVRAALPALAAGIHLNTGSVGPLPAETAAAMAELADRERDIGRAHLDDYLDVARADGRGAGRRGRRARRRCRLGRADPRRRPTG